MTATYDADAAAATAARFSDVDILRELEPLVAGEVDRHLSTARDWMPHEYVPWSQGRDFDGFYGGEPWAPDQSNLPDAVQLALVVNLLTEDNLPSYHHEIATIFRGEGAWGAWVHRWSAEEARHSMVMRDFLLTTRSVDPVALENERMVHMSTGFKNAHDDQLLHGVAYVSFQELATRISHRNTGRQSGDDACDQLMQRIALDENLHMLFYRNVLAGAMDLSPDQALAAVVDVLKNFQMPGHTIEGFGRKSVKIALAGIYDIRQHLDEVIWPVLRAWNVMERADFGPRGEALREELAAFLAELDAQASLFEAKRDERLARLAARL